MTARELFGQAVFALAAHRLRATLSSIGMIVGIATVIAALAIGEGARQAAIAEIGSLGVENIFIRATPPPPPRDGRRPPPAPRLELADARAIRATTPGVVEIAALRITGTESAGAHRSPATLVGAGARWRDITGLDVARGRWLNERDAADRRRVAVIGDGLARRLFGAGDPLGRHVQAGGSWHLVVGVLRPPGASPRGSGIQRVDPEASLIVPLTVMDVSLGGGDALDRVSEIAVRMADATEVPAAARTIDSLLRRRLGGESGWELVVPRALLEAKLRTQRTFNAVLLAVGCLALAISGIGIMNIMLANVAERTHEIGVRRAFGARRRDIVRQFTMEAAILCVAGGAAGVPIGMMISALVALLGGWPVAITASSIGLALALAISVGLLFGIYPARLAARLDPAVAIRAE